MERGDKIQRNSSRAIKHKCLKLMAFDNVKNAMIFPDIDLLELFHNLKPKRNSFRQMHQ